MALRRDVNYTLFKRMDNLAIVMMQRVAAEQITHKHATSLGTGVRTGQHGFISASFGKYDRQKLYTKPKAGNKAKQPSNEQPDQERFSIHIIVSFYFDLHFASNTRAIL